jgi:hypothetical protein
MASSKIGICNIALAMLGADAIRSFDEANKRARMCDVFYESTKNYLLAKFDWPFARKVAKLQAVDVDALGITVPVGSYAYQLPSDCVTPRDVLPEGSKTPWKIMAKLLYCRTPSGTDEEVLLQYTRKVVDASLFSDVFIDLLALGIAVRLSPSVTQDKKLTAELREQFAFEQLNAWESEANIGNSYRAHDETPANDPFVNPEGIYDGYTGY